MVNGDGFEKILSMFLVMMNHVRKKMLLFVGFGSADLDLTLTSHWPCDFTQP